MSTEIETCPNCGSDIKKKFLSSNLALETPKAKVINLYHSTISESYCRKCGDPLFEVYWSQLQQELNDLLPKIQKDIGSIPILTAHSPLKWDYEVIGLVTGQSVCGTGIFAEVSSSFNDLFGTQSNTLNSKLRTGEALCSHQLRKKALDQGGNAIIATDIDYSELGSIRGLIMVCMSGTAIKLKNIEILGEQKTETIAKVIKRNNRAQVLSNLSDKLTSIPI